MIQQINFMWSSKFYFIISPYTNKNKLTKLSWVRIINSDGSALRGIYTDGCYIFAGGLNQRLRIWKDMNQVEEKDILLDSDPQLIDESIKDKYTLISSIPIEVTDINAIDVIKGKDDSRIIAMVGSGLKVTNLKF